MTVYQTNAISSGHVEPIAVVFRIEYPSLEGYSSVVADSISVISKDGVGASCPCIRGKGVGGSVVTGNKARDCRGITGESPVDDGARTEAVLAERLAGAAIVVDLRGEVAVRGHSIHPEVALVGTEVREGIAICFGCGRSGHKNWQSKQTYPDREDVEDFQRWFLLVGNVVHQPIKAISWPFNLP